MERKGTMKYLLYKRDGFWKSFPLEGEGFSIGRDPGNDLQITGEKISRRHLAGEVQDDHIVIRDLDSRNGTMVKDRKVKEAVIKIGESFCLGGEEFHLRQGAPGEFEMAPDLHPVYSGIEKDRDTQVDNPATRDDKDLYDQVLRHLRRSAREASDFSQLVLDIPSWLSGFHRLGNLFLVALDGGRPVIVFSINKSDDALEWLKGITQTGEIYGKAFEWRPVPGTRGLLFYSYPLRLVDKRASLVYIPGKTGEQRDKKTAEFLSTLARELSSLSKSLGGKRETKIEPPGELQEETGIIAPGKKIKELIKQTRKIATGDIFVLIQGETGTGKELFARLIHRLSRRRDNKYVALNCAAIPEDLLEAELFGCEKGAFTGAVEKKMGKLELASGGTLVLDEIGDMPLHLQAKLLRALQEKEFYPLGGIRPKQVDLRLVALTHRDLEEKMAAGEFRADLFYRIAHHQVIIPSLRERKEDIPGLINHFTGKYCRENKKSIRGFTIKAREILQDYRWPGNVRQLENEINRIVNLADEGDIVDALCISPNIRNDHKDGPPGTGTPDIFSKDYQKRTILELLEKNRWNKSRTARQMNMTYRGLHEKMKRLGIDRKGKPDE